MKTKNLIIGAGISGLTYANYCDGDYLIVEKENEPGGYCRTIYKNDFVWDYAGHFFHFKTEEFKKKFIDSLDKKDYVKKEKKTFIYYKDKLIDYPFQTNIHQLDKEEFIDCLYDLFNKTEKDNYDNFLDMLYGKFGKSITEASKEKALKALREFLRPEFIARVDEIVVFNPLSEESLQNIAKMMLDELSIALKERDILFSYDENVTKYIAQKCNGTKTGARELRNIIRREIETSVVDMIVSDNVSKLITANVSNGNLYIKSGKWFSNEL